MACKHDFKKCLTPPDSGVQWYRCESCSTFAYKRGKKLTVYLCSDPSGCKAPAVDRLPGRGPRLSFLWRCAAHVAPNQIAPAKTA